MFLGCCCCRLERIVIVVAMEINRIVAILSISIAMITMMMVVMEMVVMVMVVIHLITVTFHVVIAWCMDDVIFYAPQQVSL